MASTSASSAFPDRYSLNRNLQLTNQILSRPDLKSPVVVTLRRWVVPNIGRQLILERCIHGVAEQFQSRIGPEGNSAFHNQPLLASTMTSKLSNLWPSMVPTQRKKVVRS